MLRATFRVILDACVLFPFSLRDTLLRAAAADFYQMYWSEQILEEMRRNLVSTETTTEEQAARLVAQMKKIFPESMVTDFEPFIDSMKNHPKDRHVAAAALKAGAQVVVTANLKDFADLPEGTEAQSPDDFLCSLFDLDADRFVDLLRDQAADMKRPPRTFEELLQGLSSVAPDFVAVVRAHLTPV